MNAFVEAPAMRAPNLWNGPMERRRAAPSPVYPTAMIDVWTLRDGSRITLRPILPQDHGALGEMFARLSPLSRKNRFHAAVNKVPANWLEQMTCVDHQHHVAFVMTTAAENQERIIADARYVVDGRGHADGAEFAIVVDETWRRRGLGERAIRVLCTVAASTGLRWLHGDVLAHNQPMLGLMRKGNFCCTPHREDDGLMVVEAPLDRLQMPAPESRLSRVRRWLT